MRAAVWQIDFRASLLTIAPTVAGLGHVHNAVRLPFRPYSSPSPSPIVELGIEGRQVAFLVDTGFAGGLAIHPRDVAGAQSVRLPAPHPEETEPARLAAIEGPSVVPVLAAVTVRDLPPRLHLIETSVRLTEGLGLMGVGFLSDGVLTIDWASETLYLDPQPNQRAKPSH
jgi:hypothetical protein